MSNAEVAVRYLRYVLERWDPETDEDWKVYDEALILVDSPKTEGA